MKKAAEERLISFFATKRSFSRQELADYFQSSEGEIKDGTLSWRIFDLKKKNFLNEVAKGHYSVQAKPIYVPPHDPFLYEIGDVIRKNYRTSRFCVTDVNWLNEFTMHQFDGEIVIAEIEKDLEESLANKLSDHGYLTLRALRGILTRVFQKMIITFPLITRAPIQIVRDGKSMIMVPTLEKLLVDIYKDEKIFHFVQGKEMVSIFESALDRYAINYSTLFTYAKRRGKEPELREFINRHFPEHLEGTL